MSKQKPRNQPQRQLTREEKRELVKARIKEFPELGDRVIGRQLGVSHTFVGDIRRGMGVKLQLDTSKASYLTHPYIVANPQLLENLDKRGLRALRAPGVVEVLAEKSLTSPVYAQKLLYKAQIKADEKAADKLTEADIILRSDDVNMGLPWIEDNSIDAVVVDPPYADVPLYKAVAELSVRVLKPGGVLVAMSGQAHLDAIIKAIGEVEGLRYLWLISYLTRQGGGSPYYNKLGAMPYFKPVLIYIKGQRVWQGRAYDDVIEAGPLDKSREKLHKWEQDLHGFEELVRRFTRKGDTVLDCCMGSGTTGVAAIKLGRKFTGCDIDPVYVETARDRILGVLEERKNAAE